MNWFLSLFSSNKAAEKAIDIADKTVTGVGKWIDNWNFTEEERSEAGAEMLKLRLQHIEKTMNENSIRSVARRTLACAFVFIFLFLVVFSIAVFPFFPAWAEHIDKYIELLQPLTGGAAGFYFLYYGGEKIFKRGKE